MTPAFNLATDPWIPVATTTGTTTVTLRGLFDNADHLRITTGDHLTDTSLNHFALAIDLDSDQNPADWLADHHNQLDLFDPTAPFGQYQPMRDLDPTTRIDITELVYPFRSAAGSFSSYDSTLRAGLGFHLTPAEAAQTLITRHLFSIGGLGAAIGKHFGVPKLRSATAAVGVNRPLMWPTGTLHTALSQMRDIYRGAPRGTLRLTMTATPGNTIDKPGILDALFHPARSIYLHPNDTGEVTAAHYFEGHRLADEDITPELLPTTTWQRPNKNKPWQPRKASLHRPAWRQILDAMADNDGTVFNPNQFNTGFTLTTLCAYTSRVDGLYHHTMPRITATSEDANQARQLIDTASKKFFASGGRAAAALYSIPAEQSRITSSYADRQRPHLHQQAGRSITEFLAGARSLDDVATDLNQLVTDIASTHASTVVTGHPYRAAHFHRQLLNEGHHD